MNDEERVAKNQARITEGHMDDAVAFDDGWTYGAGFAAERIAAWLEGQQYMSNMRVEDWPRSIREGEWKR